MPEQSQDQLESREVEHTFSAEAADAALQQLTRAYKDVDDILYLIDTWMNSKYEDAVFCIKARHSIGYVVEAIGVTEKYRKYTINTPPERYQLHTIEPMVEACNKAEADLAACAEAVAALNSEDISQMYERARSTVKDFCDSLRPRFA